MEYSSTKKVSLPGISFAEFDETSSDDDSQFENHDNDDHNHGGRGHSSDGEELLASSSGGVINSGQGYDGFQSYKPFMKSSNTNQKNNDQLQTPSRARADSPAVKHDDDDRRVMTPSKTRSSTPARGLFSSILPANTPKRNKTPTRAHTPSKTPQQPSNALSSYNYQSKTPNDKPLSKTPSQSTTKKKKRPKTPTLSPTGLKAIQTAELLVEEAQASETVSERVEAVIGSALENVKGRFAGFGKIGLGGGSATKVVSVKSDGVSEVKKSFDTAIGAPKVRNKGENEGAPAPSVEKTCETNRQKEKPSSNTANRHDAIADACRNDDRVESLTANPRDVNIESVAETGGIDATLESTFVSDIGVERKLDNYNNKIGWISSKNASVESDGVAEVKKSYSTVNMTPEIRNNGEEKEAQKKACETNQKNEGTSFRTANGDDAIDDANERDERVESLTEKLRDANIGNIEGTGRIDATLECTSVPDIGANRKSDNNNNKTKNDSAAVKGGEHRQQVHGSGVETMNAAESHHDDNTLPDAAITPKATMNQPCTAKVGEIKEGNKKVLVLGVFNDGCKSVENVHDSDISLKNVHDRFHAADDDGNSTQCAVVEANKNSSVPGPDPEHTGQESLCNMEPASNPKCPSNAAKRDSLDLALPSENLSSSKHQNHSPLQLDEEANDFVPSGLKDFLSREESKLASLLSSIDQIKSTPGKIDNTLFNEMDEDVLKATPDFGEIGLGLEGWSSVKKKLDLSRGEDADTSALDPPSSLAQEQKFTTSSPDPSPSSLNSTAEDTSSSPSTYQPNMKSLQEESLSADEVYHANNTSPPSVDHSASPMFSPLKRNTREESSESIESAEEANPNQRQGDVSHQLVKLSEEKKDDEINDLRQSPESTESEEGKDVCTDDNEYADDDDVLASVQQFFEEAENAFLNAMASPIKTSKIEVDGAGTFVEDYIEPHPDLVADECKEKSIVAEAIESVGLQSSDPPNINESDERDPIESFREESEDDQFDIPVHESYFGPMEQCESKLAEEISSLSLSEKNSNLENVDHFICDDAGQELTGIATTRDGSKDELCERADYPHGRFLGEDHVFDLKTTCVTSTNCFSKTSPEFPPVNDNVVNGMKCRRNFACQLEKDFEEIEQKNREIQSGTEPDDQILDAFPPSTKAISLDSRCPHDTESSMTTTDIKLRSVDNDIHSYDNLGTASESERDHDSSTTGEKRIAPNNARNPNISEIHVELVKQSRESIWEECDDVIGGNDGVFAPPEETTNPEINGVDAEPVYDDDFTISNSFVVNQSTYIQDISMAEPSLQSKTKNNNKDNLHLGDNKSFNSDRMNVDSPSGMKTVSNSGASDEDVNESLFMPNMSLDVTLSPVKDSPGQVPMEDFSKVEDEASSLDSDDEAFFPNRDLTIGKCKSRALPAVQPHAAKSKRNESLEGLETRRSQPHQPHMPSAPKDRIGASVKYRTTPVHSASRKSRLSWDSSASKTPLSSSLLGETVRTTGVSTTKTPKPVQPKVGMQIVRTGTKTNYSRKVAPLWSPPSTLKPAKKRSKNALSIETEYEEKHMARHETTEHKCFETNQDQTTPSLNVKRGTSKSEAADGIHQSVTVRRHGTSSQSMGKSTSQLARNKSRKPPSNSLRNDPSRQNSNILSDEKRKEHLKSKKSRLCDSSATKSMRRSLVTVSKSRMQTKQDKPTSSYTKPSVRQFNPDNPLQQERLKRLATPRSIKQNSIPSPKKGVDSKMLATAKPPSFLSREPPKTRSKSTVESETEMMQNVKPFKARPILGSSLPVQSRFQKIRSKSCPRQTQHSPPTPPKPHLNPSAIKPPSFLAREAHSKAPPQKVETLGESIQHYLNRGGFRDVPPTKPVDRNLLLTPKPPSFLHRDSTIPRQKVETLGESIHHYMNHLRDLSAPSSSAKHGSLSCDKQHQKNKNKARKSSSRVPYYIRAQQEHAACKEKLKQKAADIEAGAKRMNQVKARSLPKTTYVAQPINIERSQVKLTMPQPPKLSLDTRMEDRHLYDKLIREQHAHEDAVKLEEDRLRDAKADQELRLKRQLHIDEGGLVFRAKEIFMRLE